MDAPMGWAARRRPRSPRPPETPDPKSARFPTKFRIRHARTKTGCTTCRRRKKKCDESRPRCAGCVRNGLDCCWPRVDEPAKPQCRERRRPSWQYGDQTSWPDREGHQVSPHPNGVSFLPMEAGTGLTPESHLLFRHYLTDTATMVFAGVLSPNPFITCLLPLAMTNPLLMHSILAVSGSHLTYRLAESLDIQLATRRHYAQVLHGVQTVLSGSNHPAEAGILPLVIALLCKYEALSCSPAETLFLHLNAARNLLHGYRGISAGSRKIIAAPASTEELSEAQSLAHETLAYFILCNTILPSVEPSQSPGEQFTWPSSGQEASWRLFGAVFGGSYPLFQLIPEIKTLYCLRFAEEAQGAESPSQDLNTAKEALMNRITAWAMDPLPDAVPGRDTANLEARTFDWEQKRNAAECLRQALYIYVALSLLGSESPSDGLKGEVQQRIDGIVRLATYLQDSPCSTNLLWAIVVAGSCMENIQQREGLIDGLKHSRYQMRHLQVVQQALQLLWADDNPRAYGPVGLRYVTEKHGMSLVIV